MTDFPDTYFV